MDQLFSFEWQAASLTLNHGYQVFFGLFYGFFFDRKACRWEKGHDLQQRAAGQTQSLLCGLCARPTELLGHQVLTTFIEKTWTVIFFKNMNCYFSQALFERTKKQLQKLIRNVYYSHSAVSQLYFLSLWKSLWPITRVPTYTYKHTHTHTHTHTQCYLPSGHCWWHQWRIPYRRSLG